MNYTLNYSFPYSTVLPPCNIKNMCASFLKINRKDSISIYLYCNKYSIHASRKCQSWTEPEVFGRKISANKLYMCVSLTMGPFNLPWDF